MDRYSFAGKGNILLKAAVNGSYNGRTYEAQEPIAYFTNVDINVNFAYKEKLAKVSTENLVASAASNPSYLSISSIKISESLQSLLYKKQTSKTKDQTIIKNLTSASGILFLPLSSDETLLDTIFVFDSTKNKIIGYTVDKTENTITGLDDGIYNIFYTVSRTSSATYFLDAPKLPNIAAEIHIDGNLSGITGDMVIHLNSLQLLTRPTLDFNTQNPFSDTLEFIILSDKEAEVNYYAR